MTKVSIITECSIENLNGNVARPRWEYNAIKKNGFNDIQLLTNFKKKDEEKLEGSLIHAQQLSGRLLERTNFITDIHGLEYFHSDNLARGFSIYSWKKYAFRFKFHYWKKIEERIFQKSLHLICAGESIFERVQKIQNATLVRNSIILEEFPPTECNELKIALVGPFLPGKINYLSLGLIKEVCKRLSSVQFIVIGKTDENFRSNLRFRNVNFVGETRNYLETLRSCSVLFAPYPEYAYYLGSKNKIIEAAACNMPIVTSHRGAIDFNENLLLVGENENDFVEKISYLENENIRKDMGKKLRIEVEKNHNAEIESKKIIKLYREFIN